MFQNTLIVSQVLLFIFLSEALPTSTALMVTYVSLGLILILGEWFFPQYEIEGGKAAGFTWDILFLAANRLVISPLATTATQAVLLPWVITWVGTSLVGNMWPSGMPLFVQVFLAILALTFLPYWVHRAMHHNGFLWRVHRIHHLPSQLTWMKTAWGHPLDFLLLYVSSGITLLLLGIPIEVAQYVFVIMTVVTTVNHCNVRFAYRSRHWFFPGIREHRHHHDIDFQSARCNYGTTCLIWDHIFKTYNGSPAIVPSIGVRGTVLGKEGSVGRMLFRNLLLKN